MQLVDQRPGRRIKMLSTTLVRGSAFSFSTQIYVALVNLHLVRNRVLKNQNKHFFYFNAGDSYDSQKKRTLFAAAAALELIVMYCTNE